MSLPTATQEAGDRPEVVGMTLPVSEVFPTLSGEAPTAGQPATFVRLHDCKVRCQTCDTLYAVFTLTRAYRKGYLQGLRRAAGHLTPQSTLLLGPVGKEALDRAARYWTEVFAAPAAQVHWPPGSQDQLELHGAEALAAVTADPRTEEERRGFVAGVFDAIGSCFRSSDDTSAWQVMLASPDGTLLDLIAEGLNDWRFRYARRMIAARGAGRRNRHTLHVGVYDQAQRGLGADERAALAAAERQRFFDAFRPAITRTYGPFLRRWQPQQLGVEEILPQCTTTLVVISGSEPLQQDLDPLITALHQHGHRVQIETSGAFDFKGSQRPDILVCSPKPNMRYRIAPTVEQAATIFKLVNGPPGSGFDWNRDLAVRLRDAGKQVYVMPWGAPPTREAKRAAGDLAKELEIGFSPRLQYDLNIR
jgi:organic radical activating enzyme